MLGLLMGFAAWGIFWGGWGALLPEIKAASGASDGAFGLALLAIALGALPAMLAIGTAIDRVGPRAAALALAPLLLDRLGLRRVLAGPRPNERQAGSA